MARVTAMVWACMVAGSGEVRLEVSCVDARMGGCVRGGQKVVVRCVTEM